MSTEAPFHKKVIDVLALQIRSKNVIAIELKVKNWRKALRQAVVYQLCAHKVYVGIYGKYLNDKNLAAISDFGIGVISVDKKAGKLIAKIIREPKISKVINRTYSIVIIEQFKKRKQNADIR